jgi:putative hydrolase of HD superfamily
MINQNFIRFIYEAASMQRWNDHIRPHKGFTELDKQAHKMFYAYALGKLEDESKPINWTTLIEGALFEFFHRILLTDIKPVVFHRLMEEQGEQLNKLVYDNMEQKGVFTIDKGISDRMWDYLFNPDYGAHEKKILEAAHYMATNWEFQIVYRLSSGFYGLEETQRNIARKMDDFNELECVKKLNAYENRGIVDFLNLIGQLRFQQRWAQTPRLPETSVAGHMLIVAVLTYMLSLTIASCDKRKYNNFFAALFHDLPEVLTRDIISPVKSSIEGLDKIIKGIEEEEMERVIYPMLPEKWRKEIMYFTNDEFESKIIVDRKKQGEKFVKIADSEAINRQYNEDIYCPVDGELIEFCDKLSAYLEAYLSIKHGITSRNLVEGHKHIYNRFKDAKIAGLDLSVLMDDFKL